MYLFKCVVLCEGLFGSGTREFTAVLEKTKILEKFKINNINAISLLRKNILTTKILVIKEWKQY